MLDRDRPSTWVPYRPGLCRDCKAGCCYLPLEVRLPDLVRLGLAETTELSPKKVAKRLAKAGLVRTYRAATGLFLLQQRSDGSCPFLGRDQLCTVYEARPAVCRGFPLEVGPRLGFCPHHKRA